MELLITIALPMVIGYVPRPLLASPLGIASADSSRGSFREEVRNGAEAAFFSLPLSRSMGEDERFARPSAGAEPPPDPLLYSPHPGGPLHVPPSPLSHLASSSSSTESASW